MKKTFLLVPILLGACLCSCKKENNPCISEQDILGKWECMQQTSIFMSKTVAKQVYGNGVVTCAFLEGGILTGSYDNVNLSGSYSISESGNVMIVSVNGQSLTFNIEQFGNGRLVLVSWPESDSEVPEIFFELGIFNSKRICGDNSTVEDSNTVWYWLSTGRVLLEAIYKKGARSSFGSYVFSDSYKLEFVRIE